jgi:hypothetical protein
VSAQFEVMLFDQHQGEVGDGERDTREHGGSAQLRPRGWRPGPRTTGCADGGRRGKVGCSAVNGMSRLAPSGVV